MIYFNIFNDFQSINQVQYVQMIVNKDTIKD